jgi:hypothetical protein
MRPRRPACKATSDENGSAKSRVQKQRALTATQTQFAGEQSAGMTVFGDKGDLRDQAPTGWSTLLGHSGMGSTVHRHRTFANIYCMAQASEMQKLVVYTKVLQTV